ncbi:MAG: tyrosine-type recombinase/integrase [Candidatus Heimdallarchaeota archaeon]|nr:tyrosine-type recombinase/integrase [Candidatus Heimdallarchaeota archaeon]MCK5144909.1 tyrosine-type recombinase/integrase [Candidatus Heimdallarchaeota archaeon]
MDNLEKYIEDFLTHIRIEKNYSGATTETYRIALTIFAQFLLEANISITDKKCIIFFISYLKEKGNSDVTIAHRLTTLKSFFNYLVEKKIVSKKKLPSIEKYKTTKKIISIPTDEEVNLFIDTIEDEYRELKETFNTLDEINERLKAKYFSLFRDLTFFTLVTATGLRISEALNINREDMSWNECTIKIFGKGAKERLIFFGIDRLKNLFNEFFKIRDELGIESPYLFVSYQHRKVLTPRYIQKVMKDFLEKTASSNYTPHTLRHYYATCSIEKGANIKAIAILLGHADPSTTIKMYYHISKKILREVFETTNPFSNIVLSVKEMMKKRYEVIVNL